MNLYKGILILSVLILLLVSGASGVTIVINDGTASLSIAATPDGRAAVSVVAAVNPGTYSATMSGGDTNGVSAGQESSITGAGSALSISAAFSPDGASALTGARVTQGDINTTQTARSGNGAEVSVEQSSTVAGQSGRAGSVATDSEGNRAYQIADFWDGILDVNQSAGTSNSAAATQDGLFCGFHAVTRGSALAGDGQRSYTRSGVFLGATTFYNAATASGDTTTASQDVTIAGFAGSSEVGARDNQGNFALQSASFIGGVLNTNQTADTFSSANATQTGDFVGPGATVNGFAQSSDGDISLTHAGVLVGKMTFDNAAVAEDTTTLASQRVDIAGLFGGQAGADSFEHGNIATQDFVFTTGWLNVTQTADTFHSARATQTGDFAGHGGIAAGFAISPDGDVSTTDAELLLGEMTFANEAVAQDTTTVASQDLTMAGVLGHAGARSIDQEGNFTNQFAFMAAGSLTDNMSADTFTSANAYQQGTMSTALGFTGGDARSGDERSWTNAGVVLGTMDFGNFATANGDTYAGQGVLFSGIDGIPVAGAGSTSAGSDDGTGNITEVGAGFVLGTMDLSMQYADTEESAFASQFGTMGAGYGFTSADAEFENERSWSDAEVLVGTMAFDNIALANGSTYADNWMMQFSGIDGISVAGAGRARAGSDDGTNTTMTGTEFLLGTLDITQVSQTDGPGAPLYSNQTGEIPFAAYGHAWGEAFDTGSGATSWTDGSFLVGAMDITGDAGAGASTSSSQVLNMTALAGSTGAGSDDNAGNATEMYTEFIVGMLDVRQGAATGSSASADQSGTLIAGFGNTGGEAISGYERSWTESNIMVGVNNFTNTANTGASTYANQTVTMVGLSSRAVSGSDDGTNTTEVGAEVIIGTLDVDQRANTTASAHAGQSGTVITLGDGRTWNEATSGDDRSWTSAQVTTGLIVLDSNNAAAGASTSAEQGVFVFGINGRIASGSMDSINSTEVGAEITGGSLDRDAIIGLIRDPSNIREFLDSLLDGESEMGSGIIAMDQETDTSGSAHASQSGRVMAFANGRTWGNATSGDNHSWTNASVVSGTLTVDENRVTAGTSTSGVQNLKITGPLITAARGEAWVGSTDGTNYTEAGAGFTNGRLTMNQLTDTTASAYATQSGLISAISGTGNTWGNAISGDTHSWTNASVSRGLLTVGENTMTAGGSTSGVQDVYISALGGSGDAWVGSTDGTNYAEVGAGFTSGSMAESYSLLGVPQGYFSQGTNTGSSAYATQSGVVRSVSGGNARIWGLAFSGDGDRSFTEATVGSGDIKVTSNSLYAGNDRTSGVQILNLSSLGGGSALTGSVNNIDGNYASVSAGYLNSGSRTSTLDVMQNTETDPSGYIGCATAYQPYAKIVSYNTNLGGAWTHTEAGNSSGREVYVDTVAKSGTGGILNNPRGVTITSNSYAVGGLTNSTVYEYKTMAKTDSLSAGNPSSNSTAFASNGIGTPAFDKRPFDDVASGTTTANAWANLIDKYADVTP